MAKDFGVESSPSNVKETIIVTASDVDEAA